MKDIVARIEALQERHRQLHGVVEALEAENAPDDIIHQRKKEKLNLKDEIETLKNKL